MTLTISVPIPRTNGTRLTFDNAACLGGEQYKRENTRYVHAMVLSHGKLKVIYTRIVSA